MSLDHKVKFVITEDDDVPGFAGFVAGSANLGEAKIKVNIPATLIACAEHKLDFYEIMAENTVHEMLHVFQELYKKVFDEIEVEIAIEEAKKYVQEE